MTSKRGKAQKAGRVSVHLALPADVATRLRAFAGFHGRSYADVAAEGIRLVTRGFSARQDPVQVKASAPADPGLTLVGDDATEAA